MNSTSVPSMEGNDLKEQDFLREVSFGALGAAFMGQGSVLAKGTSSLNEGTGPVP